ncbi:MAG: hypothetical protein AAGU75_08710 [Bacillota bacterium]
MSELQLKITMGDIDINLQGEGELVYKIFKELREEGLGSLQKGQAHSTQPKDKSNDKTNPESANSEESGKKTKSRKKGSVKQPQLLKDLDLSGKGVNKSLKDFVNEKKPSSNIERSTVYIYYLQNELQIAEITIDHVFTCYKDTGVKYPQNIIQNLSDISSSKYGYIETTNGKYKMSISGTNFVEHDLPKKE